MIKAVIFDFDYTLGDSADGVVLSVNYALERLGFGSRGADEIKRTIGLPMKDTLAALTGERDGAKAELFAGWFREKADRVMVENTWLYDGVKETLQSLKDGGRKIGIVTTKYHYRIVQILERFGASNLPDLIVGAEDVKIEKPHPEGLLWDVNNLGVSKDEVLYVGDSLVDARTAENAGVAFAAVLTGTTSADEFKPYKTAVTGENIQEIYHFITDGK